MRLGLCIAPAAFQRLMNDVFGSFVQKHLSILLVEVLAHSKTEVEHLEHSASVFNLLRHAKMKAKLKKF